MENTLSDVTVEVNADGLIETCTAWKEKVSSAEIETVDVTSIFEPLTSEEIATSYVPSLKTAIERTVKNINSISELIKNVASTQASIDENAGNQVINSGILSQGGTIIHNGGSSSNSSGGSSNNSQINNSSNSQVGSSNNNIQTLGEVNKEALAKLEALDITSQNILLAILGSLCSKNNISLNAYLEDESYKDILKQTILTSESTTDSIKEIFLALDPKVVQCTLKEFIKNISIDFTTNSSLKEYIDNLTKSNNIDVDTVLSDPNKIKDIVDVARYTRDLFDESLLLGTNIQENLLKIIDGNNISGYSDSAIGLARNIINKFGDPTPENKFNSKVETSKLLTDKQYENYVENKLNDISKSLSYIDLIGNMDLKNATDALKTIYQSK